MVFVPKPNPNMSTVLFEKKQKVEHKGTWTCKLSGVLQERTWLTLILAVGLNLWNKTCDLFIMKYSLTVDINFKQLDQKASLFSPLRFKRGWKSFPTFRKEWEEKFEGIGYVVNRRVLQENRSFWTCLPETCSTIHELSGIVLSDMWLKDVIQVTRGNEVFFLPKVWSFPKPNQVLLCLNLTRALPFDSITILQSSSVNMLTVYQNTLFLKSPQTLHIIY